MGGMNKSQMIVVSDDKEQADIMKRYYPTSYLVSNFTIENRKGVHNLNQQELLVSKDQLNVDMLIDFCVLSKCERIFTTVKDSRYAQEARRLHNVIDKILN